MDFLVTNLGDNRITQHINTNEYEQSTDYAYMSAGAVQHGSGFFEDLFKQKNKSESSASLISQNSSCNLNTGDDRVTFYHDTFMYIMYYINTPSVSLVSKDTIPRILKEFRTSLMDDETTFAIKKFTKTNKQHIVSILTSFEPVITVDEVTLCYFAHYLKTNLVMVKRDKTFSKGMLCADDNFQTAVLNETKGTFKLMMWKGKPTTTWDEVKEYLFEKAVLDPVMVAMLSVFDLRKLAVKLGINTHKDIDGKQVKILKEELKAIILKKI